MKAISVFPGKPDSVHLTDLDKPKLDQVPNGRGVLVKVLRVGVDGTDKKSTRPSTAPRLRDTTSWSSVMKALVGSKPWGRTSPN